MIDSESCYVSGPSDDYPPSNDSLGKFLLDALKRRAPDDIVNAATAENLISQRQDLGNGNSARTATTLEQTLSTSTQNSNNDLDPNYLLISPLGSVLTCQQLIQDSIKAAGVLKHLGIQNGDVIAIISENSINYCVPVLAALYVGAIVNTLNPGYAIGELKHDLGISKPKLILFSESALGNLLKIKEELEFSPTILLMRLRSGPTMLSGPRSDNRSEIISFENLLKTITADVYNFEPQIFDCSEQGAFIFSYSGNSGPPKSVLLTHKNWTAALACMRATKYMGIRAEETTISILPLFHIFGQTIHVGAIAFSMKQIVMIKFEPSLFLGIVQEHKVTKIFVAPPLLLFLAASPLVDSYDLTSLRDILVGAAPVGKQLQDSIAKRFSGIRIRQGYVTIEMTSCCIMQTLGTIKSGSLGFPVPGITAMIWDAEHKIKLGPLKTGELCIKGATVMKGYVNNAIATEESIDEEGFYHSGDLGYYDHEGNFYLVDRMQELIKCKGVRTPPAELEALILTHPEVKDCGVIGIPDEKTGQVPLAYVVRQSGANVTEKDVMEYVASRISAQKRLYGGVNFIDNIPKSSSGKILRKELMEIFKSICQNETTAHQNEFIEYEELSFLLFSLFYK